jgi:XRE family transcriptional regulator, regulator of sulfur utilization
MSTFVASFGARLKELRESRSISQEQLAHAAGLHRTHISLIERGQRSIRLETLERLSKALGVPPSEMFLNVEGGGRRS